MALTCVLQMFTSLYIDDLLKVLRIPIYHAGEKLVFLFLFTLYNPGKPNLLSIIITGVKGCRMVQSQLEWFGDAVLDSF